MAGRGRGRGAWKPKTVGAQFAQQASEDLGMKLGSAMKRDEPPALYPAYKLPRFTYHEHDAYLVDAYRDVTEQIQGSVHYMPHKDHRSGNSATASAFKDALQTLQTQLAGTPLVTKELVAASTHRVAKRARSFSVSSAAAEEGGAPPAPKGRTRQRSIDYTVDALLKKEHKAGTRDLPDIDDADVEDDAGAVDDGEDDAAADYTVDYGADSDGEDDAGGDDGDVM